MRCADGYIRRVWMPFGLYYQPMLYIENAGWLRGGEFESKRDAELALAKMRLQAAKSPYPPGDRG